MLIDLKIYRSFVSLITISINLWASQVAQRKTICLPVQETQETWVPSLSREDPLEKEMGTHSRISVAYYSPWGRKQLDSTE